MDINGIEVTASVRRVGRKWQLVMSGPEWLINDIQIELLESGGLVLESGDVYKIVLSQRLPLLEGLSGE